MSSQQKKLKSVLLGHRSLALNCAIKLHNSSDFILEAIITTDKNIKNWGAAHNIPVFVSTKAWRLRQNDSIDYLFSVVNEEVLPPDIISLPTKAAINFHDSLLPKYAGVHATSWALLNNEESHGVSWHIMTEKIDAGDIIKQKVVNISQSETAISLNMKCYEAAIELFDGLLTELSKTKCARIEQVSSERTYFPYRKKPFGYGLLNWRMPAEDIYTSWRAVNFGFQQNDFASSKILTSTGFYIVQKASIRPKTKSCEPGKVVSINFERMCVSTSTDDVVITKLKTLNGNDISFLEFKQATQLKEGDLLPVFSDAEMEEYTKCAENIFDEEKYWVQQWRESNPVSLPYITRHDEVGLLKKHHKFLLNTLKLSGKSEESWTAAAISVFIIYFNRLTDKSDMSFGISHDYLNNDDALFAKVLPLNVELSGEKSFNKIFGKIKDQLADLNQRKTYSKDIGYRYPCLENSCFKDVTPLPCQFEINGQKSTDNFHFKVLLEPKQKTCELILRSSSLEEFDASDLLLKIKVHISNLVDAINAQPDAKIYTLEYLDSKEKAFLLQQPESTPREIFEKSIVDHFKEQVLNHKNRIATIYKQTERTYEEIDRLSDLVANEMLEKGVKPQDPVVIFMYQSDDAVLAMLSALKINAVYVPIDPSYPAERIQFIINDVGAKCILTRKSDHPNLKSIQNVLNKNIIDVNSVSEKSLTEFDRVESKPDDLAYILYTSGSTGQPKGVKITHKGVIRLVKHQNYIQLGSDDVVAQFTTLIFDGSTFEIWGALLNGSTLKVIKKNLGIRPKTFAEEIKNDCTILLITPSIFAEIFKVVPDAFDNLHILMLGGEALRVVDVHAMLTRIKLKKLPLRLINGYGPTENTTLSTYYDIENIEPGQQTIPIGKSIKYSESYVVDENLNLLPAGVPGELYLGGDGLATGYINQDALTQDAFVQNPFAEDKSQKLYKTGDMVRILSDGNMVFLSRLDDQVKIRGFRVELKEIENCLLSHESVENGVVVSSKSHLESHHLIAYLVLKNDCSTETIRSYLAKYLPSYMVPFHYVILDELPLTSSQKIDRSKLPPLEPFHAKNFEPGVNKKERFLINIWEDVLKLKNIGRKNNFFSLGGDSIIAMQVMTKINQKGWNIKASDIFQYPTIEQLARRIKLVDDDATTLLSEMIGDKVKLSAIHHWFLNATLKHPSQFSQRILVKLSGQTDPAILEKAFDKVIQHHDMLRCYLVGRAGSYHLKLSNNIDLFKLHSEKCDENEIDHLLEVYNRKINLSKPPLIKAVIIQTNEARYLGVIVHHVAIDGVSWRVLIEDIYVAYESISKNPLLSLPPKTTSYQAWVNKVSQLSKTTELTKTLPYWQSRKSAFRLPKDFERHSGQPNNNGVVTSVLDLRENSFSYKYLRPFEFIMTAITIVLHQWTKSSEVSFFIEGHGREVFDEKLDVSRTVGWFTSLYPVKINNILDDDFLRTFRAVRHELKNCPHHGASFGMLRYLSENKDVAKELESILAPDFCLNFLGNFDLGVGVSESDVLLENPPIRLLSSKDNRRLFDIEVTAWIINNQLHFEWRYNTQHFKSTTIKHLVASLTKTITALDENVSQSPEHAQVPADYPLVNLDLTQFDYYHAKFPNLDEMATLSPIQAGMLYYHLQQADSKIYHAQFIWDDSRGLDIACLKKAWDLVVKRHSIFRTRFVWENLESPIQIVDHNPGELPWKEYDFSELTSDQKEANISKIISEDYSTPFDFLKPPLMRVSIVKLDSECFKIIWTHHHILLGGWSINTVVSEVYSLYDTLAEGSGPTLLRAIPYTDYVRYLKKSVSKNTSKSFWKQYLSGFTSSYIARSHLQNGLQSNSDFDQIIFSIPPTFVRQLKLFASEHSVSLNAVMLMAWTMLISRYAKTTDVTVGIVMSTRLDEYEFDGNIVGPLINTLPFRVKIDESDAVLNTLSTITEHVSKITQYKHTSLIDIYSWLKRNVNQNLFDTLFAFENYPFTLNNEFISNWQINDLNHYPLTMSVHPHDGFKLVITYFNDLLEKPIVQNIMSNYYMTLRSMVGNANQLSRQVNVISKSEYARISTVWNQGKVSPNDQTMQSLFAQAVQHSPRKIAVRSDGQQLTYAELDKLSTKWANYLQSKGIKNGEVVAIYMRRQISTVVAIFAVLKSGAGYVALHHSYPSERIEFILKDAKVKCVLTQPAMDTKLKQANSYELIDITDNDIIENQSTKLPVITSSPEDIISILYTSGTTGIPKGVQVRQKGVCNVARYLWEKTGVTNKDKLLSVSYIGFDVGMMEVFGSLLFGLELVFVTSHELESPASLIELIHEASPSIINATPSFWQMLITAGWKNGHGMKIFSCGEVLTPKLADTLLKTKAKLYNHYGPTEATIMCTLKRITSADQITIGKPISNTVLYVLDEAKRLVPIGVPGELYVGGDGVANAYLNRPDLTKNRFITLPHLNSEHVLYSTGDSVRWLPSGELEYIDRLDNQIKLRGYRIELEEVRAIMIENLPLQNCIVIKVGSSYETAGLVAFCILRGEVDIPNDQLKSMITPYLPAYMLPSQVVVVKKFPLTNHGKVDKKKLLELLSKQQSSHIKHNVRSNNPNDQLVLDIYRKVLGQKNIGYDDSFFDVGGNSVSSIWLLTELKNSFSVSLTLHDLLSSKTPRRISSLLLKRRFDPIELNSSIASPIVCLQEKGKKQPLYLIHPVGGAVFWFVKLAKLLGESRPVYALQDPGLASNKAHFSSFESMATFYKHEIQKVQPSGPYYLAGASYGATMAVEIARQLIEDGEKISFVGLLDGWAHYPEQVTSLGYLKKLLKRQHENIKTKVDEANSEWFKPIANISWHRSHLLANYKLQYIDIPITLFKAEKLTGVLSKFDAPDNLWSKYTPGLNIVSVKGGHESMFYDPNVEGLAKKLSYFINNEVESVYELSPSQSQEYISSFDTNGSANGIIQCEFSIHGNYHQALLLKAIECLIQRYSIMRTAFYCLNDSKLKQIVHQDVEIPYEVFDLRSSDKVKQQNKIKNYIYKDRAKLFNFAIAPLFRLGIFELENNSARIVMTTSRLVCDKFSFETLLSTINDYYTQIHKGDMPNIKRQYLYRSYVEWIGSQNHDLGIKYWSKLLTDDFTMSTFKLGDSQSSRHATASYKTYQSVSDEAFAKSLAQYAKLQGLTLNAVFHAAWALLLSRYTDKDDIAYETETSGRSIDLPQVNSIVGKLGEIVPIKMSINHNDTLVDFAKKIQAQHEDSLQYSQYFSMYQLRHPNKIMTHKSGYLFNYNQIFKKTCEFSKNAQIFEQQNNAIAVNLSGEESIKFSCEYRTDCFKRSFIRKISEHYFNILKECINNPKILLKEISILSKQESTLILKKWNNTDVSYEKCTVLDMFESVVEKDPNGIASVQDGGVIIYQSLNDRANQIAHYLIKLGAKKGSMVGLYLENSFDMLASILGILKCGAACVPIYADSPEKYLDTIMKKCDLIIMQKCESRTSKSSMKSMICLDNDWQHICHESEDNLEIHRSMDDVAFVFYSSTSVSQTKNIIIKDKKISNFIHWVLSCFSKDELAGVLFSTPLAFDTTMFEIFSALCSGGCVHIVQDIKAIATAPFSDNITLIHATPTNVRYLLSQSAIPALTKSIVMAWEKVDKSLVDEIYEKTKVESIYNIYKQFSLGGATYIKYPKNLETFHSGIGRPIANAKAYVLDHNMSPVPIGVPGELFLSGDVLTDGYKNAPESTKKRFIKNPFNDGNKLLFRSKQLVTWTPKGCLDLVDTLDDRVSIKGHKIMPQEVSDVLTKYPGIKQASVVVNYDQYGEAYLSAYFVPKEIENPPNYIELIDFLKLYLFDYMIPKELVQTTSLKIHNEAIS